MNKEIDLCRPCYEKLAAEYELTLISRGVDQKVTCANCGKRRYGASYSANFSKAKSRKEKK